MSFVLASEAGTGVPRIIERPLTSGFAPLQGALMLVNGSGEYAECGADPASIAAVAATPGGADTSGFNVLGVKNFPPGYMQGINIGQGVRFRARYVGTLPAAIGGSYGVIKDSDGLWKVDFAETVATRVKLTRKLTDSPENIAQVIVEFLAANVQPN